MDALEGIHIDRGGLQVALSHVRNDDALVVIPAAQRGILRLVKPAAQHLIGGVILHFRLEPPRAGRVAEANLVRAVVGGHGPPVGAGESHGVPVVVWAVLFRGRPGEGLQGVEIIDRVRLRPAVVIGPDFIAVAGQTQRQRGSSLYAAQGPGGRLGGGSGEGSGLLIHGEAFGHGLEDVGLYGSIGVAGDILRLPLNAHLVAAAVRGVIVIVLDVVLPMPDMGDGALYLDPALADQIVRLCPGILVLSVYRQRGAGAVAGLPEVAALRPLPRLQGDIEVPTFSIAAVDREVSQARRCANRIGPVLHVQGQVQSLVVHIPVVNGLLIAVVIAVKVQIVVDGLVVEDVIAAVVVPQSHHIVAALPLQVVPAVLLIHAAHQHDVIRVDLDQEVEGPCLQGPLRGQTVHLALLLQPGELGPGDGGRSLSAFRGVVDRGLGRVHGLLGKVFHAVVPPAGAPLGIGGTGPRPPRCRPRRPEAPPIALASSSLRDFGCGFCVSPSPKARGIPAILRRPVARRSREVE